MRYTDLSDLEGFLWWLCIKFCKTNLKDEQTEDKWSRNILTFLTFGSFIGFMISVFDLITFKFVCCNVQTD